MNTQLTLTEWLVLDEEQGSDDERRIHTLETSLTDMKRANEKLLTKIDGLEGCSRCNNIKILGLPERGRPTEFIAGLLPKLLGANNFAKPVRLDRAHRIPVPKPTDRKRQRSIIARINFFQEKELILRLSRQQLMYNNHRVYIFPSSHTAEVMEQRRGFREVTQVLREREVKYSLRFPAKLHVHYKEQVTVFTSPQDALSFIKQVFSTLFLNLLNLVQTVFGGRPLQGGM